MIPIVLTVYIPFRKLVLQQFGEFVSDAAFVEVVFQQKIVILQ
jgi:hypothetical protein